MQKQRAKKQRYAVTRVNDDHTVENFVMRSTPDRCLLDAGEKFTTDRALRIKVLSWADASEPLRQLCTKGSKR